MNQETELDVLIYEEDMQQINDKVNVRGATVPLDFLENL